MNIDIDLSWMSLNHLKVTKVSMPLLGETIDLQMMAIMYHSVARMEG